MANSKSTLFQGDFLESLDVVWQLATSAYSGPT